MTARSARRDGAGAAVLAAAIALAFADSSIVMLGLPEIYGELDASIPGVSLVITAYNLIVAVVALLLIPVLRIVRPPAMLGAGLVVFLVATLACGLADSLPVLVAMRGVQGLGGALLLAASLPAMAALTGSASAGRAWWGLAGTLGAVLGPAVGGVLTEVFDWRAIFIAQAPVALLALVVLADPRVRGLPLETRAGRVAPWPNLGLVFAFGALVGALFLAVLMIVTVWGLGPLPGALVVSVLPVAAVLVRPLSRRAGAAWSSVTGAPLLAAGLVALALLPQVSPGWAAAALAVCGAGFGLLVPPLTAGSVDGSAGLGMAGTVSVGARHVGLVIALAIVAPVLADDLAAAEDRATLNAAQVILDARLELGQKVPVALELADEFGRTPRGQVPDLQRVFDERGAADDPALAATRDDLLDTIEAALTRGFRAGYLVSALLALLALVPIAAGWRAVAGPARPRPPPRALAQLGVAVVAAGALIAGALAAGGLDLGRSTIADPCAERVRPEGGGLDAAVQGIVLDGLAGAACELDVSREELVLSTGPDTGAPRVPFDPATIEEAVRAGLVRAIDDAEERGSLNGIVADVLRAVVRRTPVEELIRGGVAIQDLVSRVDDIDIDPGALLDRARELLP